MRFAYADPPYPGLARRYYRMPEVDHRALIRQLIREYPHGWALSTSSEALFDVLNLIPIGHRRDVRLCSWHRGSRPCPTYWGRMSWEPLILWRGRPRRIDPITPHDDSLVAHVMQRPRTHSKALVGMKPPAFCEWMFRQLGALEGDELHDMFPGSGVVGRAWKMYTNDTRGSRLAGATRHPREKR